MANQCIQCGRFVPNRFVAISRHGEYGGGYPEDETLCAPCGGPSFSSDAYADLFEGYEEWSNSNPIAEESR